MALSPTEGGGLGFWSPSERRVIDIEMCHVVQPRLLALWQEELDLVLPDLRKLTLRLGEAESLMAALEVEGVEPPELETDLPISVGMVLPDKTAVSLVGDFYFVREVMGRRFRVSPGCDFLADPLGAALVVEAMLAGAGLQGDEVVLELYSGVGVLTAFLAVGAAEVVAVEVNGDAVADMVVNLDDTDNVSVYEGMVEAVLPTLDFVPDVVVLNPPGKGPSEVALAGIGDLGAARLVYVGSDVATLARDGQKLP